MVTLVLHRFLTVVQAYKRADRIRRPKNQNARHRIALRPTSP